jgi:hypothetical protein
MKQAILIQVFFFTICPIFAQQDTTNCSLIKEYKTNQSTLKNVVKISYDEEIFFYTDLKSFLKYASNELSIFKKYKSMYNGFKRYKHFSDKENNDTLFVNIKYNVNKKEQYIRTYVLEVKFKPNNNKYDSYISEKDTTNKALNQTIQTKSIEAFYFTTKKYLLNRILKKKKVQIFHKQKGTFMSSVIKENYSYYYSPMAAGGGIWFRIKGTKFVFSIDPKWIS